MPQGRIKRIVSDRGFGFISAGRGDVFFHFSALDGVAIDDLQEGQLVDYEVDDAPQKGKGPRATSVRMANG